MEKGIEQLNENAIEKQVAWFVIIHHAKETTWPGLGSIEVSSDSIFTHFHSNKIQTGCGAILSLYATIPAPSLVALPASHHVSRFSVICISNITNLAAFDNSIIINSMEISVAHTTAMNTFFAKFVLSFLSSFQFGKHFLPLFISNSDLFVLSKLSENLKIGRSFIRWVWRIMTLILSVQVSLFKQFSVLILGCLAVLAHVPLVWLIPPSVLTFTNILTAHFTLRVFLFGVTSKENTDVSGSPEYDILVSSGWAAVHSSFGILLVN
jgi:hypothetical protein